MTYSRGGQEIFSIDMYYRIRNAGIPATNAPGILFENRTIKCANGPNYRAIMFHNRTDMRQETKTIIFTAAIYEFTTKFAVWTNPGILRAFYYYYFIFNKKKLRFLQCVILAVNNRTESKSKTNEPKVIADRIIIIQVWTKKKKTIRSAFKRRNW